MNKSKKQIAEYNSISTQRQSDIKDNILLEHCSKYFYFDDVSYKQYADIHLQKIFLLCLLQLYKNKSADTIYISVNDYALRCNVKVDTARKILQRFAKHNILKHIYYSYVIRASRFNDTSDKNRLPIGSAEYKHRVLTVKFSTYFIEKLLNNATDRIIDTDILRLNEKQLHIFYDYMTLFLNTKVDIDTMIRECYCNYFNYYYTKHYRQQCYYKQLILDVIIDSIQYLVESGIIKINWTSAELNDYLEHKKMTVVDCQKQFRFILTDVLTAKHNFIKSRYALAGSKDIDYNLDDLKLDYQDFKTYSRYKLSDNLLSLVKV